MLTMVIVNYNDFKTTKKLIDNVKNYKSLTKIVIVDNNSTDNSYTELKKIQNKKISVIKNYRTSNLSAGFNLGARYVIKTIGHCPIIISNSDIIIKSDADLKKLANDLSDEIGVVGPIVLQHGTKNRGWKLSTPTKEILYNLPFFNKYFKQKYLYYTDDYYQGELTKVDVVSGCFFVLDSKVLEKVNFFDDNTLLYYEENILAKKVQTINKKIVIDNTVSIIHDHSVTIDKAFKKIEKYKILKESQKHYVKNYLKANKVQLFLLFITNKITLFTLYVRCYLGRN